VASVMLVGDPQRYADFRLPAFADRWPGAGPLGAIATALGAARQPWCLVLACDMPNVTVAWLEWLLARATKSSSDAIVLGASVPDATGADAVAPDVVIPDAIVPETNRGLEPLCAIYRASCARALAAALDSGVRKVTDGLARLNIECIGENVWRQFSPNGDLFQNLNTWEDYTTAKKRLEA
jgi:molybdopterin-guanine dinucleotide biosynthesis protein A